MRVDRRIVDANFVVQVRARGSPAVTDIADHFTTNHLLARDDCKARHVSVDRLNPVAVIDDDLAAIAVRHFSRLYSAIARSANGKPIRRADVDTGMEFALAIAQDRVFALAKATCDWSHDGPQRWNIGSCVEIASRPEQ